MSGGMIFLIAVLVVVGIFIVATYNSLIALIEAINNAQHSIDVQLDRRFKVFESLINVIKKSMDYEKTTLKEVVALRSQSEKAKASGDAKGRIAAENKISALASNLNVVFEQYPDLKANQQAMQLQEEIVNTENKLAFAKQALNDSIERYEVKKKSFFEMMVVSIFSSLNKSFEYWHIDDEKTEQLEDYKVEL